MMDLATSAATGAMECRYGERTASFTWAGNDEMGGASGYDDAINEDDDTLTIDLHSNKATKQNEKPSMIVFQQPVRTVLAKWRRITTKTVPGQLDKSGTKRGMESTEKPNTTVNTT